MLHLHIIRNVSVLAGCCFVHKADVFSDLSSPPSLPVRHPRRFHDDSERFLSDILLPNLVWRAGRTAAAVRTSALSCLLAVLHGGAITPGQVFTERTSANPSHV